MQLRPINGSPTEEDLDDLSYDIVEFWQSLGLKLKVPYSNIKAIQLDNVQYPQVKDKAFQMLMDWLDQGESATFDRLSKALRALGKERLRKKYCGGL